jgi:hypothetical protein
LGIFRVTEIWVASQPRTDRVIPLIEKRNIPEKKNIGFGPRWKWHDRGMILRLASHLGEKSKLVSPGSRLLSHRKTTPDQN